MKPFPLRFNIWKMNELKKKNYWSFSSIRLAGFYICWVECAKFFHCGRRPAGIGCTNKSIWGNSFGSISSTLLLSQARRETTILPVLIANSPVMSSLMLRQNILEKGPSNNVQRQHRLDLSSINDSPAFHITNRKWHRLLWRLNR